MAAKIVKWTFIVVGVAFLIRLILTSSLTPLGWVVLIGFYLIMYVMGSFLDGENPFGFQPTLKRKKSKKLERKWKEIKNEDSSL